MLLLKSVASVTPGLRANKTDGKIQYSEKNVEQGSKEKDQLSFRRAKNKKYFFTFTTHNSAKKGPRLNIYENMPANDATIDGSVHGTLLKFYIECT
jgi:hypothetical protein